MKKLSIITTSLVLFAGICFAQQSGTPTKATPATSKTAAQPATVKKVPTTKNKAVPMVKKTTTDSKTTK